MFHVTIYRQGTNHSKFLSQLVHEMVLLNTIRQGMNQTGHESVKVPESACVHEMVLLNAM